MKDFLQEPNRWISDTEIWEIFQDVVETLNLFILSVCSGQSLGYRVEMDKTFMLRWQRIIWWFTSIRLRKSLWNSLGNSHLHRNPFPRNYKKRHLKIEMESQGIFPFKKKHGLDGSISRSTSSNCLYETLTLLLSLIKSGWAPDLLCSQPNIGCSVPLSQSRIIQFKRRRCIGQKVERQFQP